MFHLLPADLHVLRAERRYKCLDITGVSGVTDAQRAALLAIGTDCQGTVDERDHTSLVPAR